MSSWIAPILIRLAFVFEPLTPRFVSLVLSRRLAEWKRKGLIYNYETETKRIGKFHYRIDLNLDLTPEQARSVLRNLIFRIFKRIRR